ncbi:MAG TPA: bestrophin family ion channel [Flavipsychrobacter sp.]
MYTRRTIRWSIILLYAWKYLIFYACYSALVVAAHHYLDWHFLQIPFLPISAIAVAVAFYLGFKNNSSYDRLWEARRVWGSLVNASRTWGIQVLDFVNNKRNHAACGDIQLEEIHRRLIYRHIAFLNALRLQLRRPAYWEQAYKTGQWLVDQEDEFHTKSLDKELQCYLPIEEVEQLVNNRNAATQLIRKQSKDLEYLYNNGIIDSYHHVEMTRTLAEFYNQQGAAERIKSFPFPRQYAYFSSVFTWIFILLLPFGLINEFQKMGEEFEWLVVPFHLLIAWVFNTMEIVGASSENPFENSINDVPITAICKTVEIDLREMLGEADLPPKPEPVHDILM